MCVCHAVKNGKNGKPHVLTLQDLEDDNLQFDISAETLEELFEWYQAAWDITQRTISNEYNRQHEVSISSSISRRLCRSVHDRTRCDSRRAGYLLNTRRTITPEGLAVLEVMCFCPISDQTAGGGGKEGGGCYGNVGPGGLLSATQQREGPLW